MTNTILTAKAREDWVVACGGTEPVMLVNGKHYQLHWERNSGARAYYCQEDDLFLTAGLEYMLPECLT